MRSEVINAGNSEKGEGHQMALYLIFVFHNILDTRHIQFPFALWLQSQPAAFFASVLWRVGTVVPPPLPHTC